MSDLLIEGAYISKIKELKPILVDFVLEKTNFKDDESKVLVSPFLDTNHREVITFLLDGDEEPISFDFLCKGIKAVNLWLTFTKSGLISDFSQQKFSGRSLKNGSGNLNTALLNIQIRKKRMSCSAIKALPKVKLIEDCKNLGAGFWGIQPKFDGIRMIVSFKDSDRIDFLSRHGVVLNPGQKIKYEIENRARLANLNRPEIIIDGEVCAIDKEVFQPFQKTSSMLLKKEGGKDDLLYIIFDVYNLEMEQRLLERWLILETFFKGGQKVRISPSALITKEEFSLISKLIEPSFNKMYEGFVIKSLGPSHSGLKSNHFKYKFFEEIPVVILKIYLGEKKKLLFSVRDLNKPEADAQETIGKFSEEDERVIFNNRHRFIGTTGHLRFCQKTKAGFYRSAVFYSLPIGEFLASRID